MTELNPRYESAAAKFIKGTCMLTEKMAPTKNRCLPKSFYSKQASATALTVKLAETLLEARGSAAKDLPKIRKGLEALTARVKELEEHSA